MAKMAADAMKDIKIPVPEEQPKASNVLVERIKTHSKALSLLHRRACYNRSFAITSKYPGVDPSALKNVCTTCKPLNDEEIDAVGEYESWLLDGELTNEKYETIVEILEYYSEEGQNVFYERFALARQDPNTEFETLEKLLTCYGENGRINTEITDFVSLLSKAFNATPKK
jgi:hypothetical protein